jgi:hypothetical protein
MWKFIEFFRLIFLLWLSHEIIIPREKNKMLLAVLDVSLHITEQELTSHVGRIKQHLTAYRPTPQNRVVNVTGSLRNTIPPPSLSDDTRCSKSIRSDNTVGRGRALGTRRRRKNIILNRQPIFETGTSFSSSGQQVSFYLWYARLHCRVDSTYTTPHTTSHPVSGRCLISHLRLHHYIPFQFSQCQGRRWRQQDSLKHTTLHGDKDNLTPVEGS